MHQQNKINVAKKLAKLQQLFSEQLFSKVTEIEDLWQSHFHNTKEGSSVTLVELIQLVRRLSGSADTYGATTISSVARELERILDQLVNTVEKNSTTTNTKSEVARDLIVRLRQVADDCLSSDIPFIPPSDNTEQCVNNLKDNNLVYLAEGDELLAKKLILNLEKAGYQVRHFSELNGLEQAFNEHTPVAIIVNSILKNGVIVGVDFIHKIENYKSLCTAVIFISTQDDFEVRLAAARAGAHRFFCKPFNIKKLINSLDNLTIQLEIKPYRILIIDDDEISLKYYETLLTSAGMDVEVLLAPLKNLSELLNFKPDVIVMDICMSEYSGFELAQVIRQDDAWALIPILFLSTEPVLERKMKIININNDDILVKPITAQNIVSTVCYKARRTKLANRLHYKLENSLRESELYVAAMNQHDIVSTTDITGKIITVNAKFCEISGYSRDELLGENHRLLRSGIHSRSFYDELWRTISTGNVWHGTICNRKKDGDEYWVESTIVPFLDFEGKPYKYVSARTDITPLMQSEERLIQSQIAANIGTWDWNIVTGSLFWSERIWTLFGYDKEVTETSYDNFLNAVHPEDRKSVVNAVQNCVDNGAEFNIEHRVVWSNGSVHWMYESGDVVRNEDGTALHMLGVVQDITLRKKAEIKLQESEERNRLLLQSVGEGVYGLDLNGNTTFVNPAFCEMLGFTVEDIIGKPMHSLIHHSYSDGSPYPREKCPMHAALRDGKIYKVNNEVFWHKNGSSIPVEYISTPVLKNGELVGVVTIFQNISQRLKVDQALVKAKEEAENANLAKSRFLSSMSHELRTPMNAIMGFGQLLTMDIDKPLDESQQENVDEIMKAANHLLELINEILDLAKIESGKINLSIEKIMLADVVSDSLQLITPLAKKRGIDIFIKVNGVDITPEQMLKEQHAVQADHMRLKQILLNLLGNAVKYNRENGDIIISCDFLGNNTRINITDTGEGFNEEQKSKLFKPFERLGANQTEIEGAGIGLVITKNIIERMNGIIGVESEAGKGSTFWIELPRDDSSSENGILSDERNAFSTNPIAKIDHEYTILYIEDNPANLRLVTQLLSRLPNVHIWSAREPILGLELANEHKPDLILLDINLPGIDGFEVMKRLRRSEITCETPVIAISANAMEKDLQNGIVAGFNKYITKPIDVTILLQAVNEILSELK